MCWTHNVRERRLWNGLASSITGKQEDCFDVTSISAGSRKVQLWLGQNLVMHHLCKYFANISAAKVFSILGSVPAVFQNSESSGFLHRYLAHYSTGVRETDTRLDATEWQSASEDFWPLASVRRGHAASQPPTTCSRLQSARSRFNGTPMYLMGWTQQHILQTWTATCAEKQKK